MIKNTLYFGNPAYLSLRNKQLVIKRPSQTSDTADDSIITRPIEDIGIIVLDNRQITITQGVVEALLANNCALITCDSKSLPVGLMLPLSGNSIQSERFKYQIAASLPLKKQLWQQTMQAKILNQAAVLSACCKVEVGCLRAWAADVKSGDPNNLEARAAVYYWKYLFKHLDNFIRDRDGDAPNHLLNYGYAILRAIVARSLVCNGMLPTLGIHHHNRYNAYCLADDIMEPYRPYVDELVYKIVEREGCTDTLTKEHKAQLLTIPTIEVTISGRRSPLMVGVGKTTASLLKCFSGESRKIAYPQR